MFKKNQIILKRKKNNKLKGVNIKYVRVKNNFEEDYKYPNPIYYYTRNKNLTGNYILKDSLGIVISNNFKIQESGLMSGYPRFENKYIYYSTDIYCGIQQLDEYVIICDKIKTYFQDDSFGFVYKKISENIIFLYDTYPRENNEYPRNKKQEPPRGLGKATYRLIKH